MGHDILALDVGTSGLKAGIYSGDLEVRRTMARGYEPRIGAEGQADIDPETWWSAIASACAEFGPALADVSVVSLSVTTPGLTPMASDGTALGPAILMMDGRAHAQAAAIRTTVGEGRFLAEACNLPVSGGSSLASILWIRDHQSEVWDATAKFGHTNTYVVKRLTGDWAIDPSTTSITGLYATARDELTWAHEVLEAAGIGQDRLPPLMRSFEPVGQVLPHVADELGLPREAVVLCGGNDASLAAWSGGLAEPGDANIISGTTDIANVCTDTPVASPDFNVRCHVVPGRWLTFFVLNTGGVAYDWFWRTFCGELEADHFFSEYVPGVLEGFLADPERDARERALPTYVPYLSGSRYSTDPLRASFDGLSLATTRDDLLLAMIKGNLGYVGEHLKQVAQRVPVNPTVGISGGAARIRGMLEARRRWTGDFEYVFQDQSSLLGAAMLGQVYQGGGAA